MTRAVATISLMAVIASLILTSFKFPHLLDDHNSFLREFVNQELLALLGVIVTITLASAANLHLELNRIENRTGEEFSEARKALHRYAGMLIGLFAASVILVILKPVLPLSDLGKALFNSAAIVIILLNLLSLADLSTAIFQIPPDSKLPPRE